MKSNKPLTAFGTRLLSAFGKDVSKSEIARKLDLEPSAISNYLYIEGRLPSVDILKKASDFTRCSIHWLITGEGEKLIGEETSTKKASLDDTFREIVREVVVEEIARVEKNRAEIKGENIKQEKAKPLVSKTSPKK